MEYKKEVWKEIEELDNCYKISNKGRIMNKKTNKILSIKNSKGWYLTFRAYVNGKRYTVRPHRLVAKYFIPNPNNYNEINHIDMNKQNNCVENLEWCNRKYNINEAIKKKPQMINGIIKYNKYKKSFNKYGYIYQFDKDMNFINKYLSPNEAYKITGVCSRNILHCINHQEGRKQAGGYIWIKESEVVNK